MIHPDTELRFIDPAIGYSVVATKFIPKGTITWIHDPLYQVFIIEKISSLPAIFKEKLHRYSYRDSNGSFILCWDNSRFINHSFLSNCISTPYKFELTVRDIQQGQELTDDYGYLNVTEPFECIKEKGSTRKTVYPDDLLFHYRHWDELLIEAFRNFNSVSQPFHNLIDPHFLDKVIAVANGTAEMDSILNLYCPFKTDIFAD